jgi:hypothetical protein
VSNDPRDLGGDIAGPGGPYDENAVVVSVEHAVLLDNTQVALVEAHRNGEFAEKALALLMEGRINKTQDRAKVLFLLNGDGAAALVTELVGVAKREGEEFAADFVVAMEERTKEMP